MPGKTTSGYARSGGAHVAYQVSGEGPADLVLIPDGAVPIDLMDDEPSFALFLRGLESFARVIRYDRTGTGMSDPAGSAPTLEQWARDGEAVLDALGSQSATLMGLAEGGTLATVFAAGRPQRTSSLVLVNAMVAIDPEPFRSWGTIAPTIDWLRDTVEEEWGRVDVGVPRFAPSAAGDERFREWLVRGMRRLTSPATAAALFEVLYRSDIRDVLPLVRVPTLVIQRADNTYVSPEHGRYLAEHVDGARYVEVPGPDHVPYIGDQAPIIDAVRSFVATEPSRSVSERFLGTAMFTDIVGSTARAALLGDQAWHRLLTIHHTVMRGALDRHSGREVDTTGDGFFALFDGPASAIACADDVMRSLRSVDLEVRAGVHTGECELVDGKPGGMAVVIGARVAALAGPGEILVSRTVRDLVAGSGLTFVDRGEHTLKGVSDSWQLFAVVRGG